MWGRKKIDLKNMGILLLNIKILFKLLLLFVNYVLVFLVTVDVFYLVKAFKSGFESVWS